MREELEKVLYHQRLAHKAWLGRMYARGTTPTNEISQLVWELLLAYGDSVDNFDHAAEDIYQAAYELAGLVLRESSVEQVYHQYRDHLIESMLEYTSDRSPNHLRALVRFSNILSSAICEANVDTIKRSIRHQRAERFSQELSVAKKIQSHLLPKVIPTLPGFEFAGRLIPATEIGGDYWSVKYHPKDEIVTLKLADITGHGIAAATLVAAVKFISGGYYKGSISAAEVMQQTNRVLSIETPHEILVSMVYGWLRPDTYDLSIVNAGHAPAFICSDTACIDLSPTGPLLGLTETAEYGEVTFTLSKNDLIFFGSDGIIEAGIGERFGLDRLKYLVLGNKDKSADEIADLVVQEVADFAGQPNDDVSLVIVKVTADPPVAKKTGKPSARTRDI